MKRATGLGGFFFKSEEPAKLLEWYDKHLGLGPFEYGSYKFDWRDDKNPDVQGSTVWCPFKENSDYFKPSGKDFMFNFRVDDLTELVKALKEEGVEIVGEVQEFDYGKFAWIVDPEGNKIELWEPPKA